MSTHRLFRSFGFIAAVSISLAPSWVAAFDRGSTTAIVPVIEERTAIPKAVQHPYVGPQVWDRVRPFLMPDDHPLKAKLDKIFQKKRASASLSSLKKAGFTHIKPQKWTRVIVANHKKMKGYIFKLYTDDQRYHQHTPEYEFWILRATGAELIRKEIQANNWGAFVKVPKKWIYALPPSPKAKKQKKHNRRAKNFILVEEDMDILSSKDNMKKWRSGKIAPVYLDIIFHIVTKHGFWDSCKPENMPWSKDGRIAFVDTQNFHTWPVAYYKMERVLQGNLMNYWNALVDDYKGAAKESNVRQTR